MIVAGIVRQDVEWFDREENSTGALTARLATEVTLVKNITGLNLNRCVPSRLPCQHVPHDGELCVVRLLCVWTKAAWLIDLHLLFFFVSSRML